MNTEKLNGSELTALVLLIIGGLNWLLVGLFDYNLVTSLFGEGGWLSRTIFVVVGLAGLYVLGLLAKLRRAKASSEIPVKA